MPFRKLTALALFFTAAHSTAETGRSLASTLDTIRIKYQLPALAGALFTTVRRNRSRSFFLI